MPRGGPAATGLVSLPLSITVHPHSFPRSGGPTYGPCEAPPTHLSVQQGSRVSFSLIRAESAYHIT